MRICFFSNPASPLTRRLALALADRGHEIHVVFHRPGVVPGATFELFDIPPAGWRNPHRWSRRKRDYMASFLRRFDLVSIQFLHGWEFTPRMLEHGRLAVRPWGSDVCPPPDGPQPGPDTIARRKLLLRQAHGVQVTCDWFRETVAEFAGIDPKRIVRTPLGVDLDLFYPESQRSRRPVVGFFKGFAHAYGPRHLIGAMPRIVAAHPRALFDMVGDGPLLDECKGLAESLGIADYIRWRRRVAHEIVPDVIGRWWVSVIPSVRESFCVAALESSAMRIPVVASAVGGLCETVRDGRTGILVPPGDSAAIADAVIGLLGDARLRAGMGEAGREHVRENFEWQDCLARWEAFFAMVVDGDRQVAIGGGEVAVGGCV